MNPPRSLAGSNRLPPGHRSRARRWGGAARGYRSRPPLEGGAQPERGCAGGAGDHQMRWGRRGVVARAITDLRSITRANTVVVETGEPLAVTVMPARE